MNRATFRVSPATTTKSSRTNGWYPIRRTSSTWGPADTPRSRNRPSKSVVVCKLPPRKVIWAWARGRAVALSTRVPTMIPAPGAGDDCATSGWYEIRTLNEATDNAIRNGTGDSQVVCPRNPFGLSFVTVGLSLARHDSVNWAVITRRSSRSQVFHHAVLEEEIRLAIVGVHRMASGGGIRHHHLRASSPMTIMGKYGRAVGTTGSSSGPRQRGEAAGSAPRLSGIGHPARDGVRRYHRLAAQDPSGVHPARSKSPLGVIAGPPWHRRPSRPR